MITQGLNTRGGTITFDLNDRWDTFVEAIEIVQALVGDWYVRRDKNDALIGPMSFRDADRHARYLSAAENGTGLAQVVTFLGERAGDPVTFPARLFVDGYYARGKKFLRGRAAQFHSDNELLQSAADFGMRLYGFRNPGS